MLSLTSVLISAVVAALIYYLFVKEEKHPGKLPPGPKGWPVIGSVFSLSLIPYVDFGEWVKKYGHIFTLKVLGARLVIISDPKIAREAYAEPSLNGRPDLKVFNIHGTDHGVTNTSGKVWVDQRRFTLRTLRDYGFGKTSQQSLGMEEVQDTVEWLKSNEGKPVDMKNFFNLPSVNSLWTITTGKRLPPNDPLLKEFIRKSNEVVSNAWTNPLLFLFPGLCEKFPNLTGWKRVKDFAKELEDLIADPVEKEKASYNPVTDDPQDFVEAYMQEVAKTTDSESSFYKSTGERNKRIMILDLFGAGAFTTSATLSISMLYLCKNPEIQKKLQEEIDNVVGQLSQPALDQRKSMPYTEAFICEVLRKSTITPFGLFHYATETAKVAGYTIPKGSWVAVNQYFIHHDPAIWGDPESFRPERFLSQDGKSVVKNDNLIAFSVGRRMCIGEQIAKDNLFLFLTGIMQKFNVAFDPNSEVPTKLSKSILFINAPLFYAVVKKRTE